MGANGASCQELQIAPKNRFHTNFLDKGKFIIFHRSLSIACFHFSFVQVSKLLVLSQYYNSSNQRVRFELGSPFFSSCLARGLVSGRGV